MSKLSKCLTDDDKLAPLVREISWSENLIPHRDLQKVQPLVAQIGWRQNLRSAKRNQMMSGGQNRGNRGTGNKNYLKRL